MELIVGLWAYDMIYGHNYYEKEYIKLLNNTNLEIFDMCKDIFQKSELFFETLELYSKIKEIKLNYNNRNDWLKTFDYSYNNYLKFKNMKEKYDSNYLLLKRLHTTT